MKTIPTYLRCLKHKVFKLLPMREAYDRGEKNHLYDYLDNLQSNCNGAFLCHPELGNQGRLVEVQNNIAFLKSAVNIPFDKWRAIVLRSTRLVNSVLVEFEEGCDARG